MKIECSIQEFKKLIGYEKMKTSSNALTSEEVQKSKTILNQDLKCLCPGLHEELKHSCQSTIDGI